MYAAESGHCEAVERLLRGGARAGKDPKFPTCPNSAGDLAGRAAESPAAARAEVLALLEQFDVAKVHKLIRIPAVNSSTNPPSWC